MKKIVNTLTNSDFISKYTNCIYIYIYIYICTTFTPQFKGKPVHIYHILHWFRKVNERYTMRDTLRTVHISH